MQVSPGTEKRMRAEKGQVMNAAVKSNSVRMLPQLLYEPSVVMQIMGVHTVHLEETETENAQKIPMPSNPSRYDNSDILHYDDAETFNLNFGGGSAMGTNGITKGF